MRETLNLVRMDLLKLRRRSRGPLMASVIAVGVPIPVVLLRVSFLGSLRAFAAARGVPPLGGERALRAAHLADGRGRGRRRVGGCSAGGRWLVGATRGGLRRTLCQ